MTQARPSLQDQADEFITADTTWLTFAEHLTVDRYRYGDAYSDTHTGISFRPLFLAYLWATVEDHQPTSISRRLKQKPELAAAFGFDPDDLPSRSTCKPARLEARFSELESTINRAAEHIKTTAAACGAPIGTSLTNVPDDDRDDVEPSERTIDRLLRRKGREVLDELKSVAIPAMDLPRPANPVYEKDELLTLEAVTAINGEAVNGGGKSLGDLQNPTPDIDDPLSADGPSGETLLDAMKGMSVEEIATVINFALRKTYTRAKPRLNDLGHENGARFGVRTNVAMDMTYVAYRGERDGMEWLQGAPEGKEYRWCHKFGTITIVGKNTHFVVGVVPLGSTEYADTDAYAGRTNSYYVGDVARRLLSIANEYVSIRTVYADREFHAADVVHTLEAQNLKYVIPAVKNDRIKRLCKRFDDIKRGYDDPLDTPLYVKQDFPMHGRVKHKKTNERVSTTIVVLPPDEDDEAHKRGSPQPFLTNLEVDDEIALDRRWATRKIKEYSDRGAIERSYSSIKECAAWTTSKEFEVRWFHFGFACVVYNMWLLVDFLTQERIGVIETRTKPRITLSRFLDWLDRVLVELM